MQMNGHEKYRLLFDSTQFGVTRANGAFHFSGTDALGGTGQMVNVRESLAFPTQAPVRKHCDSSASLVAQRNLRAARTKAQ